MYGSTAEREASYEKKQYSAAAFVDRTRILMPGTWNGWRGTADPADCAVLYGNRILFCKKLKKASRLVRRNEALQEASGQFRETACHDDGHKAAGCGNRDSRDGDRLLLYEKCADWTDLSGGGMGMPSVIFFLAGKDDQAGRCYNRIEKRIVKERNRYERKK